MPTKPPFTRPEAGPAARALGRRLRAPVWRALLAQLGAAAGLAAAVRLAWTGFGIDPPLWMKLAGAGVLAAGLGALFRLPRWWLPIQALLPALFYGALLLDLPGWVYAAALSVAVLALANSAGERVPLYLTGRATRAALVGLLPDSDRPVRAIDLGCGFGGPVLAMARANRHPDSRFVGVETAPLAWAVAAARAALSGDRRIEIRWRSLWRVNLSSFDLVYAFLSPAPMPRLLEKAAAEMTPGARLVSNEFAAPDRPPDRQLEPQGAGGRVLNLWDAPIEDGPR